MVGTRIKNLRTLNGYSISELAKLANVSKSYLSLIERELKTNPSISFLNKMAVTLDTSVEYLLGHEDSSENVNSQLDYELDQEWTELIQLAINGGTSKRDFRNYLDKLKYKK
jgi:XRE family transcriptional regulator, master regulator for biofilm formation